MLWLILFMYFRLTVGVENTLFHFQYFDNLEGVFVCSEKETPGASQITKEISEGFHKCCKQIKRTFDAARKLKVCLNWSMWAKKIKCKVVIIFSLSSSTYVLDAQKKLTHPWFFWVPTLQPLNYQFSNILQRNISR